MSELPLLVWGSLPPIQGRVRSAAVPLRPTCPIVGCELSSLPTRGLCDRHWTRLRSGVHLVSDHDSVGLRPSGMGVFGVVIRDEDGVLCYECGRWLGALGKHLRRAHEMTARDYRLRHGIALGDALSSLSLSRSLVDAAARKTPEQKRQAREYLRTVQAQGTQAARSAKRPAGGVAKRAAGRSRQAALGGQTVRACRICGSPCPTPNSRTCSPECKSEVFRRAAGKRIAEKAGEPTDFVAREGSGAMLTRHDVVAQYGLSVGQAHRLPPRDGRSGGLPWWWESTVIEWRSRMDAARSRPLDAYRRGRGPEECPM